MELTYKIEDTYPILDNMKEILKKKNQDYGNSFHEDYQEFGITTSLIRLSDKFRRFKSLVKTGISNFEGVEDTLKDIIGYCTLTLIELQDCNSKNQ